MSKKPPGTRRGDRDGSSDAEIVAMTVAKGAGVHEGLARALEAEQQT
jgi:hypothetical protein